MSHRLWIPLGLVLLLLDIVFRVLGTGFEYVALFLGWSGLVVVGWGCWLWLADAYGVRDVT